MKKIFTLVLIVACSHAFAQDSLKTYNDNRIKTTSDGLAVLGGWGILNIGTGAVFGWTKAAQVTVTLGDNTTTTTSSNLQTKYFFQMNTIWGVANFGAALIGFTGAQNSKGKKLSATESLKRQERIEKIFRINQALDVAYLGAGIYLKAAGNSRKSDLMQGYGESIILQGSFLLIFDSIMYHAEKGNGTKLRNFLEKHPISFDGRRVGMVFRM